MVTARMSSTKGPIMVVGLTYHNLDKLREGKALRPIDAREFGIVGEFMVWVVAGEDEKAIHDSLVANAEEHGVTVRHDLPT